MRFAILCFLNMLMQNLIFIILLLLFYCLPASAQADKIDSLIEKINNNNLYGTCNYVWVLKMDSQEANALITIGEPASHKLIGLLQTENKGIIAHYILSNIFLKKIESESCWDQYETDSIVKYVFCGLKFHENKKGNIKASQEELDRNYNVWLIRIKTLKKSVTLRKRKQRIDTRKNVVL
jgi:hypothetical protein